MNGTPSLHRTRLGQAVQPAPMQQANGVRNNGLFSAGNIPTQTPSQRRPLATVNGNTAGRSGLSGYGMSAGLKVGRQTGKVFPFEILIDRICSNLEISRITSESVQP